MSKESWKTEWVFTKQQVNGKEVRLPNEIVAMELFAKEDDADTVPELFSTPRQSRPLSAATASTVTPNAKRVVSTNRLAAV